ncbi:armadillo-type protein [Dunaliella salina]|uniref:Armadillo-type protein n=1 Tax=Dunaliella salina TaxID=3046 RepID=A0ABQ7H541_DUNSA|nr:armadillo-type protein [Dunaliella salina]|eukprot:KAF5841972.1 armadillo-type protein [Dunaliella salina]
MSNPGAVLRRPREPARPGLPDPDPALLPLIRSLLPGGQEAPRALHQLCDLTAWQEQNQRHALELGVVTPVLQLLEARIPRTWHASAQNGEPKATGESPPPEFEHANTALILACLTLLSNLSSAQDLADCVAREPACTATLVALLSASAAPLQVTVHCARCLINLTQSNKQAQAEAVKAGLLDYAVGLLMSNPRHQALDKLGCWLLANLTTPLGSGVREQLLQQPSTLAQLVQLARPNQPEPVIVLACHVLGNLVREAVPCKLSTFSGGLMAHDVLARAGALEVLQAHAQTPHCSSKVLAAALNALACLALGHKRNAATLMARPGLAASLGLALEQREDVWTADYDSACAVLAVHTLLHVLGHMHFNSGDSSSSSSRTTGAEGAEDAGGNLGFRSTVAGQIITLEGPDANVVDGAVQVMAVAEAGIEQSQGSSAAGAAAGSRERAQSREMGGKVVPGASVEKEAVYVSLAEAARAVGVVLPAVITGAQKDGSSVLQPIQVAEIRFRVTHTLLPRLRSPNFRTAATAAAALYHLAAACGGKAACEARSLMADSSLVRELLQKLSSSDPPLIQACLAVLDVLSAEPLCGEVMLRSGWLDAILPLLESKDALVQRWADRALCSLFIAGGGHMQR